MKQYRITENQLSDLHHFCRMFESNADLIEELCNSEKDDIVYGFKLGQAHSYLRKHFVEMGELITNIKKNKL